MRACFICGVPLDIEPKYGEKQGATSYAARLIVPGPGLVEVCGAQCASDSRFSLKRKRKNDRI